MTRYVQDKDDLRVQRTRKSIQEALIDLTVQKGFASVTVSDITNYAKVNRATFYRHYQDKFNLVDQYAREVHQLLEKPAAAGPSDISSSGQPPAGLVKLFEHIRANAKFFRVMLGKNGDPAFAEKIRQYIQTGLRRSASFALLGDETSIDLYLSYVASGMVGVLLWWLEHEMPYTPVQLAAVAQRLSTADLGAVHGQATRSGAEA